MGPPNTDKVNPPPLNHLRPSIPEGGLCTSLRLLVVAHGDPRADNVLRAWRDQVVWLGSQGGTCPFGSQAGEGRDTGLSKALRNGYYIGTEEDLLV